MIKIVERKAANWIFIAYFSLYISLNFIRFSSEGTSLKLKAVMYLVGTILSIFFLYNSIKALKGKGRFFWFIIMISMVIQFFASIWWGANILIMGVNPGINVLIPFYATSLLIYFVAITYKVYDKKKKYQINELAYDSAIIVTVAYTLGYIFIVKTMLQMGLPPIVTIALLGFPVLLIVLFIGLISLMFSSRPVFPTKVILLNLSGIALYVLADSFFYLSYYKGKALPPYIDMIWAIAPLLISLSGYYDDGSRMQIDNLKSSKLYIIVRIISPYISLIILFGTGIIESDEHTAISIGFIVAIALITFRQAAIMLDNRSLLLKFKKLNNGLERTIRDRTLELHNKSAEFEYQANHDSLTGLPNRRAFTRDFTEAIEEAKSKDCSLALLYLDLDSFKNINDIMGHSAGDKLLITVANRIKGALEEKYSVYRLGGDEFSTIIRGAGSIEEINEISEKIHRALEEEIILKGNRVTASSSIGIAMYPNNGDTVDSLMKSADIAMYYSKERGRGNSEYFNSSMHELTFKRMNIGNELSRALQNNEFTLFYQPQFDAKNGRVYGVEALIRWNSPSLGMVSPADFIPIAEESGLIIGIGEWTLGEACRQVKQWREQYGVDLRVGVNVSPRQFLQDNFTSLISNTLEETGLEPRSLDVEITENIAIHNEKYVNAKLRSIREMGVRISMDDFGTGYSSLSYLKELPVDTMKIAMPFVRAIGVDERDRAIVDSIISMARSLKIDVIAEGVETQEQLELLGKLGCTNIQGYLIGKPVSPEEFEEVFLKESGIINNYAAVTKE